MRGIDLSSWQSVLSTLLTLALVTLVGLGLRLVVMSTLQQRRERANRQINERLRVLIAAYKTLGGSFTGDLTVNPIHLREVRRRAEQDRERERGRAAVGPGTGSGASAGAVVGDAAEAVIAGGESEGAGAGGIAAAELNSGSDRSRRMRDAVEAALSDIILLGTEAQVGLAAHAARELVAGRHVHTHALVVSLRDFIRQALDLEPIPTGLEIPMQGPARPGGGGGGGSSGERERGKGKDGAGGGGERSAGGGGGGGGMMGIGMGMGGAAGLGLGHGGEDDADESGSTKG